MYEKADEIKYVEMNKIGCNHCTKLEYLESTGTQYIDTEIAAQDNLTVIITFQTLSVDLWQVVAGSNYSLSMYVKNNNIAVAGNVVSNWVPSSNNIFKNVEFGTRTFPNRYFKYNNDERTQNRSREPGYKLFLFGLNDNNSLFSKTGVYSDQPVPFRGRIYVVSMLLNNILVRDYIPVLDKNNRPCLFDKVSKTCFYNQGTGEFLYG